MMAMRRGAVVFSLVAMDSLPAFAVGSLPNYRLSPNDTNSRLPRGSEERGS